MIPCMYMHMQIIQEKQKFRKTPTNYAMTKSRLLRQKVQYKERHSDCIHVCVCVSRSWLKRMETRRQCLS